MWDMSAAYDAAALLVRERLAQYDPDKLETLNSLRKSDIAVYPGSYDSVEEVLRRLRVHFVREPDGKRLGDASLAFANCSSSAQRGLLRSAEPFVSDGGWLTTTDWSLSNIIQPAFPGTIRRKPRQSSRHEVVAVEPNNGSLWEGVVVLGADPQWWLESASYPIEILDEERVRVEAASHELLQRFDAPAVSVRFDWGAGRVFHLISHLWMKRTRVPQRARYGEPCVNFITSGMGLSEESAHEVLSRVGVRAGTLSFAAIQTAVTSTELVAQLCINAKLREVATV